MTEEDQIRLVALAYRRHFPHLDHAVIKECAAITVAARRTFTAQIIPFRRPLCQSSTV